MAGAVAAVEALVVFGATCSPPAAPVADRLTEAGYAKAEIVVPRAADGPACAWTSSARWAEPEPHHKTRDHVDFGPFQCDRRQSDDVLQARSTMVGSDVSATGRGLLGESQPSPMGCGR
ncbi:hypothetical protein [Streptomyces sp. NPDC001502]|uniref:hypothetical protein n=1 Tax=Streptomyces sp. NPDC001502 TaxID=3364578 RepID=UPI0036947092